MFIIPARFIYRVIKTNLLFTIRWSGFDNSSVVKECPLIRGYTVFKLIIFVFNCILSTKSLNSLDSVECISDIGNHYVIIHSKYIHKHVMFRHFTVIGTEQN